MHMPLKGLRREDNSYWRSYRRIYRMKASAELKLMGTITAQLGQRIEVGDGPKGSRLLVDVNSVEVEVEIDASPVKTEGSEVRVGSEEMD